MKKDQKVEDLLLQLKLLINDINEFYSNTNDYSVIIYKDWTAKDVLGHLVAWHESFARNVEDIVQNRKPSPLKGTLTAVNESGVIEMKQFSINDLLKKINRAQGIINKNILNSKIILIPYKKGSRDYSSEEHLEVVCRHIKSHLKDLNHSKDT